MDSPVCLGFFLALLLLPNMVTWAALYWPLACIPCTDRVLFLVSLLPTDPDDEISSDVAFLWSLLSRALPNNSTNPILVLPFEFSQKSYSWKFLPVSHQL